MLLKNKRQCKTCLFAWNSKTSKSPCCEYQLITGYKRQNTENYCQSYLRNPSKYGLTDNQKRKYYLERKSKDE